MRVAAGVIAVCVIAAFGLWGALFLLAIVYAAHVFVLKLGIREVSHILTNVTASLTETQEQLQAAQKRVEVLERAPGARASASVQGEVSQAQRLYASVGLTPTCPKFVLEAAQRAYRKALHPDLQPPRQKLAAERRFKEAEAAFAEIRRLRNS